MKEAIISEQESVVSVYTSDQLVWAKHPKEAPSSLLVVVFYMHEYTSITNPSSHAKMGHIQGQDGSLSKSSITSMSFRDVIFCTYPAISLNFLSEYCFASYTRSKPKCKAQKKWLCFLFLQRPIKETTQRYSRILKLSFDPSQESHCRKKKNQGKRTTLRNLPIPWQGMHLHITSLPLFL